MSANVPVTVALFTSVAATTYGALLLHEGVGFIVGGLWCLLAAIAVNEQDDNCD